MVKGRIFTADALPTQVQFCWTLTRWKGAYLLLARENQPTLADDLRLFFREPPLDCRDWRTGVSTNKGQGREDRRELTASTELNEFFASKWAAVAQVFRIVRTVQQKGKTRKARLLWPHQFVPCPSGR